MLGKMKKREKGEQKAAKEAAAALAAARCCGQARRGRRVAASCSSTEGTDPCCRSRPWKATAQEVEEEAGRLLGTGKHALQGCRAEGWARRGWEWVRVVPRCGAWAALGAGPVP